MYKKLAVTTIISLGVLSGCGTKPEESLYVMFEEAVQQEKELNRHAKVLSDLEQKNAELYERIIEEGKENNVHVQKELKQALEGIEERISIFEKGKTTLREAQNKLNEVNLYLDEIEDKELGKQANQIVHTYKKRFHVFVKMQKVYNKTLVSEKKLYNMLQAKDEQMKTITNQIREVNKLYKEISKQSEIFNRLTEEYNQEKLSFYKNANLHIQERNVK